MNDANNLELQKAAKKVADLKKLVSPEMLETVSEGLKPDPTSFSYEQLQGYDEGINAVTKLLSILSGDILFEAIAALKVIVSERLMEQANHEKR